MIAASAPPNEQERLADLRALHILDTPPEERFDRIVKLATEVFDVPIAYIALVDADRQWFKAKCGITADETGRRVSFCSHTILQEEPLIIPDAVSDERFQDNPLVVNDPHIRFYAGHPLVGPNGHAVGTLCIADRMPRDPDGMPLGTLKRLAELAEHELNMVDLIAAQHELIDTKTRLLRTQEKLQEELDDAARYVRSLLPKPITVGDVQIRWCFEASSKLGGDIFGYHWLDDDRLAIYLADVMGHGVGAALLASSVQAALRRQTLPEVDFGDPTSVVAGLNRAFPMAKHDDKFFTGWYGVYHRVTRELRYVGAGHPPAMLVESEGAVRDLHSQGLIVGVEETPVDGTSVQVRPGSRLYLFTDGAFELNKHGGEMLGLDGFKDVVVQSQSVSDRIDRIRGKLRELQDGDAFEDDFSLMEVTLGKGAF
ncbi:MAG: SpoIIE family protein phosphatase [Phycisphaerales bacterium]|nr:SpoIIE family protein phosphatase [Phycisphaerales bacterium]